MWTINCPHDAANDVDGDNVCSNDELCAQHGVNPCPADPENDWDEDSSCREDDECSHVWRKPLTWLECTGARPTQ